MRLPLRSLLLVLALSLALLAPTTASATRIVAVTPAGVTVVDATAPQDVLLTHTITGLLPGDSVVGIDERPATGELLLLTDNALSGQSRVYRLDLATGEASGPVGLSARLPAAPGIDVHPVADRIRVVSPDDDSTALADADTGQTTPGPALSGSAGLRVAAVAYSDNDTDVRTATTLFAHDLTTNRIGTINEQTGLWSTVGPTGFIAEGGEGDLSLDIGRDGGAFLAAVSRGRPRLFRVDLDSGAAADLGALDADRVRGIAAIDNTVRLLDGSERTAAERGTMPLTVLRESAVGTASVQWTTVDGTAVGGEDFAAASGTVTFAAGELAETITVPITADSADENDETFSVQLRRVGRTPVIAPAATTITIADDDPSAAPGSAPAAVELKRGRCANLKRGNNREDAIAGTAAGDRILGFGGDDGLFGLRSSDCLVGGTGDDWLAGGTSADDLQGNSGRDRLSGGGSADRLSGGSGADKLLGAGGADLIYGGSGRDRIAAGSGPDTVIVRNGSRDVVDCGTGLDQVTADRRDRLRRCERVRRIGR